MQPSPTLLHSRAFAEMSAAMSANGWTLTTAVLNGAWLGVVRRAAVVQNYRQRRKTAVNMISGFVGFATSPAFVTTQ